MNELEKFERDPFGKQMHKAYSGSFLNMRPAPEYASGEVILSSLYRSVGFPNITESMVPDLGSRLTNKLGVDDGIQHVLDHDTWKVVLQKTLESPKLPTQSTKRFMLLCPVVPGVAAYSGSARMSKNSWNPGNLVGRMVRMGSNSNDEARLIWKQLFNSLSVDSNDEPWANLLKGEFLREEEESKVWKFNPLNEVPYLESWKSPEAPSPASKFVHDLDKVLKLKQILTRRQWVSIIESLLRLASVSHIMWLCKVNEQAFNLLHDALNGQSPGDFSEVQERLFAKHSSTWDIGQQVLPTVRRLTRNYLVARVGINYLLFLSEARGILPEGWGEGVGTPVWFQEFASRVYSNRDVLNAHDPLKKHQRLVEDDPRILACKKGIGKNIEEFARHVLGHRQAADEHLVAYDQGYFAIKNGNYKSAPWVLLPGSVAIMMLCHCCAAGSKAPRTVEHLCEHLDWYGIGVKPNDLVVSELGQTLRNLGLVLDSPDAEGGMVILDPFKA